MDKRDWCNDEIWETVKEQPISKELTENLLRYSRIVSDNYKFLHKFSDEVKSFEQLLSKEMAKFLG